MTTKTLSGMTIHISYDTGAEVDAQIGEGELQWRATAGPNTGSSGIEKLYSRDVAPGVSFLNWLEEDGTAVSMVINIHTREISNFVTHGAGSGRSAMLQRGTFEIR
jgi:hypothetical protein